MNKLKQMPRKKLWILLTAVFAVLIIAVSLWAALSSSWYLWPRRADDWAAWGTCIGAIGTILAVIYAAQTLKSSSEAQLEESIDRKLQMDFLEAKEAETALKLVPSVQASSREEGSDEARGGGIKVWNLSDVSFHDVQVLVPQATLEPGVTLTNIKFKKTRQIFDSFLQGHRLDDDAWEDIVPEPVILPAQNYWSLGTVGPGECRKITFDFSPQLEARLDWTNQPNETDGFFRPNKMLAITFVDQKGREWLRTSQDGGRIKRIRLNELAQAAEATPPDDAVADAPDAAPANQN